MTKEVDPIQQAQVRLIQEVLQEGTRASRLAKMNADDIRRFYMQARENGASDMEAIVSAFSISMNTSAVSSIITDAIMNKVIQIIYKWLPEQGQREVARELSALKAEDILPN